MTRPKSQLVIAAHRGMAAGYPENILAASRHGKRPGSRSSRSTCATIADGHIVIMHDETVDRTTSGTGEVARMTLAEIRSLDAGSHAGLEFAGESVAIYPETLHGPARAGRNADRGHQARRHARRRVRRPPGRGAPGRPRGHHRRPQHQRPPGLPEAQPRPAHARSRPGPEFDGLTPSRSRSSPGWRLHHPPMAPVDFRQRPGRPAGTLTTGATAPRPRPTCMGHRPHPLRRHQPRPPPRRPRSARPPRHRRHHHQLARTPPRRTHRLAIARDLQHPPPNAATRRAAINGKANPANPAGPTLEDNPRAGGLTTKNPTSPEPPTGPRWLALCTPRAAPRSHRGPPGRLDQGVHVIFNLGPLKVPGREAGSSTLILVLDAS